MGKRQKQPETDDSKPKKILSPFDEDYIPEYHKQAEQYSKIRPKKSDKRVNINFIDNYLLHDPTFLREHLHNFGHPIPTEEMPREFYLKNRLNDVERKNLLDIMQVIKSAAARKKLVYNYAVLAIGSTTYSDQYYSDLEKSFINAGLTRNDFIDETSWYYGQQFNEFENYEKYIDYCKKENATLPFDGQITIFSKEYFEKSKNTEQKSYTIKKRISDILDNKGEDLDFMLCHDGFISAHENSIVSSSEYKDNQQKEFTSNLIQMLKDEGHEIFIESSYLANHDYHDFRAVGGNFERSKEILDQGKKLWKTLRIRPKSGRSMHFYITNYEAFGKVTRDRIDNWAFVQLLREGNFQDFNNAMINGNKTGVYENPLILQILGREKTIRK